MSTARKTTPRPKPKKNLLKVRGITTTDTEWAWVCQEAAKLDVSASALVRRLIQEAMEASRDAP